MGAINNFFTGLGDTIGGAVMPGAYLQGQGIDPETQKKLQKAALAQFGMGLLGSIGTGQAIGPRIGHAFEYSGQNAQNQVAQAVQQSRFNAQEARANRNENRADMASLDQGNQWNLENAARARSALTHDAEFKANMAQTDRQIAETAAYHKQALAVSAASGKSEDAYRAAEVKIKLDALHDKQDAQAKYQAILDDGTPLDEKKIARLRAQSMKFQAPSLADQLIAGLGGNPPAAQPGATATQGTMPSQSDVMATWNR
jgi:hypothetical protein